MEKSVDHLQELYALLDAFGGIKIVRDNITELVNYTNQPDFDLLKTRSCSDCDYFLLLLHSTMTSKQNSLLELDDIDLYRCSFSRHTRAYESWITQLLRQSQHRTGPLERDIYAHI